MAGKAKKPKIKHYTDVINSRIESENNTQIEYVIYVRRSLDDSSDRQAQSIPNQITKCMEYVDKHKGVITIKDKPADFSAFESSVEIAKEDNEKDLDDRQVFQDTRHLFIVKEYESAKYPFERKKRRKLMELVKAGKIGGILSYSPDRQSRNMLEGGELIDYTDKGLVRLKYVNFEFVNNAAGRMMLGIRFVFSKQYSDKLSEDIHRGNERMIEKGKGLGVYKYGYIINDEQYYEPHPIYFDLMKEAFQKKLKGYSDDVIAKRLNNKGFYRATKKESEIAVNPKALYKIRVDPFYFGILIHGSNSSDQRKDNKYYKQIINEDEYQILYDRYQGTIDKQIRKVQKEELDPLKPLPRGYITSPDGSILNCTAPNKNQRYIKKLEKLREENPEATLADIVKPHQLNFINGNKHSQYHNDNITFDILERAIVKFLKKLTPNTSEAFDNFVYFCQNELTKQDDQRKYDEGVIQVQINRIEGERKKLILTKPVFGTTSLEQKVYLDELQNLNEKIDFLKKEKDGLENKFRNHVVEFTALSTIIRNLGTAYEKANYVQKRIYAEIFGLNIVLGPQKKLTIAVSDIWEGILFRNGGRTWTGTMDLFLIREAL